jgi:regulator of sigma E protease
MVSIFLGFTNLLPLPALDGGRILFALIELVRGKPIAPEIETRVHWFGFMLLLLLGLLVIVYDILNPIALP